MPKRILSHIMVTGFDKDNNVVAVMKARVKISTGWVTVKKAKKFMKFSNPDKIVRFKRENIWI
jgi:hypothetical protein